LLPPGKVRKNDRNQIDDPDRRFQRHEEIHDKDDDNQGGEQPIEQGSFLLEKSNVIVQACGRDAIRELISPKATPERGMQTRFPMPKRFPTRY
jgi:hypothetical protein